MLCYKTRGTVWTRRPPEMGIYKYPWLGSRDSLFYNWSAIPEEKPETAGRSCWPERVTQGCGQDGSSRMYNLLCEWRLFTLQPRQVGVVEATERQGNTQTIESWLLLYFGLVLFYWNIFCFLQFEFFVQMVDYILETLLNPPPTDPRYP
jgi:hypothetical protein